MPLSRLLKSEYGASRMKKYSVVLDNDAEDDLFDIYRFVALNDSFEQADSLFQTLKSACHSPGSFPLRGHFPPELHDVGITEFREIIRKPYRILYSIEGSIVIIHCLLDGRRDMQTLLQERLLR